MIGFVVPFRPIQNSKNWKNDSALLVKTLKSICNQTSSNFKVFVVHHELPDDCFQHQNLQYIQYPYEFCTLDMLTEKTAQHDIQTIMSVNGFDQGKKALYGAKHAIADGCNYVMSVDSDDLISNEIAAYVSNAPADSNGWYVDKGYIYMAESNLLVRKPSKMNTINGSTNIVASRHIPMPDFESRSADNFGFYAAHGYLVNRLKAQNIELLPLPFYAIIYVAHTSNWSTITESYRNFSLRNLIIKTLRYQPKFKSLRIKFGL
jgi:hypothetical protein